MTLGFHFQSPVNDWPRAAAVLPAGTPIKAIDNVQMLAEAKSINPGLRTILRHHYDAGQIFGGTLEENKARARAFFTTFIDGTFRQYAKSVDFIEEWNEYLANSQNATEIAQRVTWATAAAQVWRDEYRSQPDYAHIRLVLASAAIGNDIPTAFAAVASQYDCVIGYHPYIPVTNGVIKAGEWPNYSGRWTVMDGRFKAAGYAVEWLFTEGGPVYEYGPGQLDPGGGWRHPNVYGGNVDGYLAAMRYWLDKHSAWNAANGGRAGGVTLFTSGGGEWWKHFETKQPEMDALAALAANYVPPVIVDPGDDMNWKQEIWQASVEEQIARGIPLNPDAGLQQLILAQPGYTPVHRERSVTTADGVSRGFMAAEDVTGQGPRLVFAFDKPWSGPDGVEVFGDPAVATQFAAPVGTEEERAAGELWND